MKNSQTPAKRAVLYARVSTGKQAATGVSLETQQAMAEERCAREGWVLTTSYVDVMTGKSPRRPQVLQLLKDAKARKFDVVIIYRVDRAGRAARFWHGEFLATLDDTNIHLVSLTQDLDTQTPDGRFMLGQYILIAEKESADISRRVSDNMRTLAARGRWIAGGRLPMGFGYVRTHINAEGQRVNGYLVVKEDEAAIVRLAFEKYLEIKSFRGTVDWLNREGYRTQNGTPWKVDMLERVLRNQAYVGTMAYGKWKEQGPTRRRIRQPRETWSVVENAHPAIVEREMFDAAQVLIEGRKGMHSRQKFAARHYPWSGLLVCASCGKNLIRHRQRMGEYVGYAYICNEYLRGGKVACGTYGRCNVRILDRVLIPELARIVDGTSVVDAGSKAAKRPRRSAPDKNDLTKRVADLEAKKARAVEAWIEGNLKTERKNQIVAEVEAQLVALTAPASESPAPTPMPLFPSEFQRLWHGLETQDQYELLRALVTQAVVSKDKIVLHLVPYEHPAWPKEPVEVPNYNARHLDLYISNRSV